MSDVKSLIIWILTPVLEIVFFIWNFLKNFKYAVLGAMQDLDPLSEVQGFCEYLDLICLKDDNENMSKGLPLERCTYGNLIEWLRQEPAYALIYLHDIDDNQCLTFYSSTLCSLGNENFFESSNCKLWACSWQSKEGRRVCKTLRARGFPFLALIGFKHNRPIMLLKLPGCIEGATELKAKLQRVMRDNQIHLDEARLTRQERDEAQLIRLAQDEEYKNSLAVDQEKERLRKEKEEKERKQIENQMKKQLEIEKLKEDMRSKLLPEPDNLTENVVKILFRFSNGTRLERSFSKQQPMQQLYVFVRLQESCPDEFEVVATFPRRSVPCNPADPASSQTLEEFNFGKTETLFVNEL